MADVWNGRDSLPRMSAAPPALPADNAVDPPTGDSSPVDNFWQYWISKINSSKVETSCRKICTALKEDHLCATIGCMKRLTRNDLTRIILTAGGSVAWVPSIEILLDHEFPGGNVPDSAHLGFALADVQPASLLAERPVKPERFTPTTRLGDHLLRNDELSEFPLPIEKMRLACTETTDLRTDPMTSNDTRGVSRELFKYLACACKYVAGDKVLHTAIAKKLARVFPLPFTLSARLKSAKAWEIWYNIIKIRCKHGRAPSCQVRLAPLHSHRAALTP